MAHDRRGTTVNDARKAIHAALTLIMAWLAIRLALPDNMFAAQPAFVAMARLASENTWAMLFWFAGTAGLVGLFTPSAPIRLVSVLILATGHGVFAWCLIVGGVGTGVGTYTIIAGLGYYLAWRRVREGV